MVDLKLHFCGESNEIKNSWQIEKKLNSQSLKQIVEGFLEMVFALFVTDD